MKLSNLKTNNSQLLIGIYDFVAFLFVEFLLLVVYRSYEDLSIVSAAIQMALSFVCILSMRLIGKVYQQIWRYGGIQCYIRLLVTDALAFAINLPIEILLPIKHITFARLLSAACMTLLFSLALRMVYRYAYKCRNDGTAHGRFLNNLLRIFAGNRFRTNISDDSEKIRAAILGADNVGVNLAEDLFINAFAEYIPTCFIDHDEEKIGREIHGLPVLADNDNIFSNLKKLKTDVVIFAIPDVAEDDRKRHINKYLSKGFTVKVYDYPMMQTANGKRQLREFDIEELLFRKPINVANEQTDEYYRGKSVLVTGGGGSIGSELCRQLAKMQPSTIVILDIYENGAYDIQQELKSAYHGSPDVEVEIASITNKKGLERVFTTYHPQIVINAAAHKHVPLMEHNCIEAVENNVFGTCNLIELCEKYGCESFIMVSTDKAVNPTNVMGATKRLCEMIVLSAATRGKVKYSATRFGNVLGSAGSVIPLFKKQIANGGPVTITDRRIIRYFMTIPEAVQLVLQSGAMANNGELFVLDMGQPVKILDLAENMIRLSGARDIEIVETGLRPGEKLYEELLVKTETMTKTDNDMIYIEKDAPISIAEVDKILAKLKYACGTDDNSLICSVLKDVVPTYHSPEEVNAHAQESAEMAECKKAFVNCELQEHIHIVKG